MASIMSSISLWVLSRTISCLDGMSSSDSAFSSSGKRLLASNAASSVIFDNKPFCAETGNTWDGRTPSRSEVIRTCERISRSISSSLLSSSHSPSILFNTTSRPFCRPCGLPT